MALGRVARVVLLEPQIPQNTGAIGRTCLGLGAELHLIEPLGFSLDSSKVKRAGLDYWEKLAPSTWPSWEAFERSELACAERRAGAFLFSRMGRFGEASLFDVAFPAAPGSVVTLVFGSEHAGIRTLPAAARDELPKVFLPMDGAAIRSYNLANSASVGLFELHRQWHRASASASASASA